MAEFDLFVVGGGSGGVACARRAAAHGARVALAESDRLGGTCAIRGCVPKKLMRYAAMLGTHLDLARGYGWRFSAHELDWDALISSREREIARLEGVYAGMLDRAGVEVFHGRARLAAPDTVEVNGERHRAKHVLIAVGGHANRPDVPGVEHTATSDDVLEGRTARPERVIVVGGGYIAVEQASILHGLGAEVTMIIRGDTLLRGFDSELRHTVADGMTAHGVRIRAGLTVRAVRPAGRGFVVETNGGEELPADLVLYATGRRPIANTGGLGLEALGVAVNEVGAVHVDETYASTVPGVFAVGDSSDHAGRRVFGGKPDLTPIAIAEGRALAERLFNANPQTVAYATTPAAVFGIPEAASVGLSEDEARAAGHDVVVFRTRFRAMIYVLPGVEERVFMKLVVDRATDRVLGCHMVGDDAAEIIQGLAVALTAGATKAQFDATVALHPSVAEEFVTLYQPG